jgi:hypothetical protein
MCGGGWFWICIDGGCDFDELEFDIGWVFWFWMGIEVLDWFLVWILGCRWLSLKLELNDGFWLPRNLVLSGYVIKWFLVVGICKFSVDVNWSWN